MKLRYRKWLSAAAAAILMLAALDCRLAVVEYRVDAEEIHSPVRLALVTDLHSCRYGEGQARLIDAVKKQAPDVVLLGGDIFDDILDNANAELFLSGIKDEFPCYYVTGNHEYWRGPERMKEIMGILEDLGVTVLSDDCAELEVRGEKMKLCGLNDMAAHEGEAGPFLEKLAAVGSQAEAEEFAVLLSHRPDFWPEYRKYDFDLVLCGHVHGGQWRIPGLLNGLYAPDQGLLPEYAGGLYAQEGTTMIISRGLARESTRVPRIFNRPELVIVDVY